jgi:hypothetical protein
MQKIDQNEIHRSKIRLLVLLFLVYLVLFSDWSEESNFDGLWNEEPYKNIGFLLISIKIRYI